MGNKVGVHFIFSFSQSVQVCFNFWREFQKGGSVTGTDHDPFSLCILRAAKATGIFFQELSQKRGWKLNRLLILMGVDQAILCLSLFLSLLLHYEGHSPASINLMIKGAIPLFFLSLGIFYLMGMYRQLWRYASFHTAFKILMSAVVFTALSYAYVSFFPVAGINLSVLLINCIFASFLLALVRYSWRGILNLVNIPENDAPERCLIYGAGSGGELFIRNRMGNAKFPYRILGFIDDDPSKHGYIIHGVPVLGSGKNLTELCQKHQVSTVILAMPSVPGKVLRRVVELCHNAKIKPLVMPDLASCLVDKVFLPRQVDLSDLLRRSPKSIDHLAVKGHIQGKTVLVTGAGGSIGSEICRQISQYDPEKIILLDSSEFNLYQIEMELLDSQVSPDKVISILGSTANRRIVEELFFTYSPSLVLHAAAEKHVPLLEKNPLEGILNNIQGTKVVLETIAKVGGVERFVLISSDKAVRSTNVMGATKRVCELLTQSMNQLQKDGCVFCSVRFGNVIGSSGSVIPRFIRQIQNGGPVTVTHPEVTRYFMLTSEAVALVLQATALANGGETFVLNMGEPVKIFDMARQLIMLMGKEPGKDVEIQFSGLRPGEKLYEELILSTAETHTLHDDIFIATPFSIDPKILIRTVEKLLFFADAGNTESALDLLKKLASESMELEFEELRPQMKEDEVPKLIGLENPMEYVPSLRL